jgi:diguanylate cyclase (GGDEF)-like protein
MKLDNDTETSTVTLRFRDRILEDLFQQDFYEKTISQLRWNVLLGAFLYGVLGIIDYLIIPNLRQEAWFIRYAVVCPTVVSVFLLTFTRFFQKLMQPLLIFGGLVASAGAVGLSVISPAPATYLYYTGLLLCLIFFFTFVGMRFTTSSLLSWSTFLLYEITLRWKSDIPLPFQIHNTLVLLAFILTGMWGSYIRERYMLADFLHRRTIMKQKQELRDTLHEVEEARKVAEYNSSMDPLTNLYNRRHFYSVADFEFERYNRQSFSLSLIMMDIDNFKMTNDTHGHNAGDQVLLAVSEIIRGTVRNSDIPCRYGGEEFVILLPETDLSAATGIGTRLRETIESRSIQAGSGRIMVTVSLGIASMSPCNQGDIYELIKRADQALYEAKLAGRNQVKVWNPEDTHSYVSF